MKRSEMIKIMKTASATGPSANNLDAYFDNILKEMENKGIQPPCRKCNGIDNGACEYYEFHEYEWEKEDEA